MKKELIDKLLNEQTTPEEEHLIAQELRQEEDIERWLIEDETAVYDHIVAKPAAQDTIHVAQQPPIPKQKRNYTIKHQQVSKQVSTIDSLQYYIARLEHELENVADSTYTAKAEQVIRADARLQKLVQRIMIGELTKDNVPAEALNTNKTMEEQP